MAVREYLLAITVTITITGLSVHFLRIDSNVRIDRGAYVAQPWYAYSWR